MVQGVSTHPVVHQRVNAPAELAQLGVDAVEDRVLQIEDAVREHGTVTLGIGRLLRWRLTLAPRLLHLPLVLVLHVYVQHALDRGLAVRVWLRV